MHISYKIEMLKLLGAILSLIIITNMALAGAVGQINQSPNLKINEILLTNEIGVGGIQIPPPVHFKPSSNNVILNTSENLKSIYNIDANISQTIYSPAKIDNINNITYTGLPLKSTNLNNSILYQISYKGKHAFRYLEVVETVTGFTNYMINGFENFSSINLTGEVVYQLNFSNGQRNLEIYIQGMIYRDIFTYLIIKNIRNMMKIHIIIPIDNFSQFNFQELETGNFNILAPVSLNQSNSFGTMLEFIIGIIIGLTVLLIIFTIYRKKD